MSKNKLNQNRIANMYNQMVEIWPNDDKWYTYTHKCMIEYIEKYKAQNNFNSNSFILNIGSAGNEYGIVGNHFHIDIAEEHIKNCANHFVCSAENLPFENDYFDGGLCVGSVINYCDPFSVAKEISRTLKHGSTLVMDFEQSNSWQFWGTNIYKKDSCIITSFNSGFDDEIWIYSLKYIRSIFKHYNLSLTNIEFFHLISPLAYRIKKDEQKAADFCRLDRFFSHIPYINQKSCNIILTVKKA